MKGPKRRGIGAADCLRLRYAEKTGEVVGILLQIGVGSSPWWRWTTSLAVAMALRQAVLR